jgi:RNA polymerase sigma factor (sigma-70 family)
MATGLNKVVEHIHRLLPPLEGGLTDAQLLTRFVASRDEASFAALVRRHGPMVLGVCLRLLRHTQDAEDCFQATFLVLARKGASVIKRQSLGSWLYGVAYRIALSAREVHLRRRERERQVEKMPHPEVAPVEPQDWRPWLDYELNRLPEKYRTPIVLCDLEGRSRTETACLIGVPAGTLASRLARGRRLLAKRLSRYGLTLSGSTLAVALSEGAASAVPAPLVSSTVKVALLVVMGELAALPASVSILMKGALKTMFLTKLKLAVGTLVVVAALGASGLAYRATGQSQPPTPEKRIAGKPLTEVEALRKENELLKLNLEVVLEKVRAQEAELRALKGWKGVGPTVPGDNQPQRNGQQSLTGPNPKPNDGQLRPPSTDAPRPNPDFQRPATVDRPGPLPRQPSNHAPPDNRTAKKDPSQQVENALKWLGRGRDPESMLRALDALEKAIKQMRDELKKQGSHRRERSPDTAPKTDSRPPSS